MTSWRASAESEVRLRRELRRREARDGLVAFLRETAPPDFLLGRHHRALSERLEAVERGECPRLIVSMPPRHGKSETTTRRFPVWYLGRHPERQVIVASYGATLAQKFGRDVRNNVSADACRRIFPELEIAHDSAARDRWSTTAGGAFAAEGVGGGLTGLGGHLIVVDDPVKDRQDADSATIREATWDWYRSVLRTRLMPGGAIVLVLTRWHPSDLAGLLLDEMATGAGEAWEVLNLPAVAGDDDPLGREPGEALWPEKFDRRELDAIRAAVGPREWAALYQGQPTVAEGALFRPAMMPAVDALPSGAQCVRRWDLAATSQVGTRDPDWTVGVLMARLPDGRMTIADVVRLRGGPDEVEAAIVATAARDGHHVRIGLPQDPGQAGKAQIAYLTRRLSGYTVESAPETGDKATRAAPLASQVNVGNVSIVRAPWNRALIDEMASFPSGAHDDQVDAASGAFAMLGSAYNLSLDWMT